MSQRIVVGVDGSETAVRAARWAAWEARRRGAVLDLVAAWSVPMSSYGFGYAAVSDDLMKGQMKVAEDHLVAAVDAVRSEWAEADVETRTVEGQAAEVLIDESRDADLLVVGSRGLGGFRELLLGSVGQQCAHHAACPVVIVRHERGVA